MDSLPNTMTLNEAITLVESIIDDIEAISYMDDYIVGAINALFALGAIDEKTKMELEDKYL